MKNENNFSKAFTENLQSLNSLLGKLKGKDTPFTLEDLNNLQDKLVHLSTEIDVILTKIITLHKEISKDESNN